MIIITQRPERVNNSAALFSYWGSAHQPYIFNLHRQDIQLISTNADVLGNLIVKASYFSSSSSGLVVGDSIYIASGNLLSDGTYQYYNKSVTILSILTDGATYTDYYTNIPVDVASSIGGYANIVKRTNWHLLISIEVFNPLLNKTEYFSQKLTPDSHGRMRLDASGFLSTPISRVNTYDYTTINKKDLGSYGTFQFTHSERWTGATPVVSLDPIAYSFIDGVKQVGNIYGQNFGDYVLHIVQVTPAAKYLTTFVKPTYFVGFPFSLSFIYPGALTFMQIICKEDEFTFNGSALSTKNRTINSGERNAVNRLKLSQTGYTTGTKEIDVYLRANSFIQESYFEEAYIADNYFELDPPSIASITPFDLTERKRINIETTCGDDPIYLTWKNELGGWDHWLFDKNRFIQFGAKVEGIFDNDPIDLEAAIYRSKNLKITTQNKITCGAVVSIADLIGIKTIEKSPCVLMLTDLSPITWQEVKIIPKGFQYQIKGASSDIVIEFETVEQYTLPN